MQNQNTHHLTEESSVCNELDFMSFSDFEEDGIEDDELLDAEIIEDEEEPKDRTPKYNPNTRINKNGLTEYLYKCKYCGCDIWSIRNANVFRCKSADCKRAYQREWIKERDRLLGKEELQLIKNKKKDANREYARRSRANDKKVESARDRAKRLLEQDRKFAELNVNYGKWQIQQTLASVPKIDVNL